MPLLAVAATTMDPERMIHQDGSPGSGSGQSQQELIVSSLARRKKHGSHPPPIPSVIDRPLPIQPGVQGRGSHLPHPQPVYGVSNQGYARHEQRYVFLLIILNSYFIPVLHPDNVFSRFQILVSSPPLVLHPPSLSSSYTPTPIPTPSTPLPTPLPFIQPFSVFSEVKGIVSLISRDPSC